MHCLSETTLSSQAIFLFIILLMIFSSPGWAINHLLDKDLQENDLQIGRMKVAIWPEYDDPGVLAIYDGRFADATRFPLRTSFLLPKGAIINDACSLSFEGEHFCQLYQVSDGGEYDKVSLFLPFPNFYLSFHYNPFDGENEKRDINYRIKANHAIKTMEVDIQQPLRSSEFTILPTGGKLTVEKDANHFRYNIEGVSKGKETTFSINYLKKDRQPSVDIKYSRMSGPKVFGSPYETQKNVKTMIYGLFISGLGIILAGIAWLVLSKRALSKRREQNL